MYIFGYKYGTEPRNLKTDEQWLAYGYQNFEMMFSVNGFTFSDIERTEFRKLLSFRKISAGFEYVVQGKYDKNILYNISAPAKLVRNNNGKEVLTDLLSPGNLIFSTRSFYYNEPSDMSIISLAQDYAFTMNGTRLKKFLMKVNSPAFLKLLQRFMVYILQKQLRFLKMHTLDSEERIIAVEEFYPGIFKNFNKKVWAEYLGLTPETLSRIINNSRR